MPVERIALCLLLSSALTACQTPPLRQAPEIQKLIDQKLDRVSSQDESKIGCDLPDRFQLAQGFLLERHVLVSDSEGLVVPRDPKEEKGSAAVFRTIMGGFAKAVDDARSQNKRIPRLLFYFNGGLNSQGSVEAQAARQVPCMIADGYYPVFFVWDTDAVKSYGEQVTSVWDGQVEKDLLTRARTPLMVMGNVLSGIGQAPVDWAIHSRRFWRAALKVRPCSMLLKPKAPEECLAGDQEMYVPPNGEITQHRNVLVDRDRDPDSDPLNPSRLVPYVLLTPVRLATTPFAHGLGEAAWANFLRRTRTTIRRSIEFKLDGSIDWDGDGIDDDQKQNKICQDYYQKTYPKGAGAFGRFFETMVRYRDGRGMPRPRIEQQKCDKEQTVEATPNEDEAIKRALKNAKITLIGHSMGAIVINELVERFRDLPYSDIVVMASAATLRNTRRVIDRYFEEEKQSEHTRFFSLMLHPLNDLRERQVYGSVPSGSVLMWIDEMYDVPKTPEDRVFGFWPTAKPARRMFGQAAQIRTLYRVFSYVGADGEPAKPFWHGHFNDDEMCFWRPSFWGVTGTNWEGRYKDLPEQALRPCGGKNSRPPGKH